MLHRQDQNAQIVRSLTETDAACAMVMLRELIVLSARDVGGCLRSPFALARIFNLDRTVGIKAMEMISVAVY
jgi:hypothetical protein